MDEPNHRCISTLYPLVQPPVRNIKPALIESTTCPHVRRSQRSLYLSPPGINCTWNRSLSPLSPLAARSSTPSGGSSVTPRAGQEGGRTPATAYSRTLQPHAWRGRGHFQEGYDGNIGQAGKVRFVGDYVGLV